MQKSTFWKLDSLHNFRVSNKEKDSKIGMYAKNWVDQAPFKKFYFLVKVKDPLGQSFSFYSFFFFIFFIFLQAVQTRSDFQVGSGQTRVVEDDIIHDVMRRGHVYTYSACGMCRRVACASTWVWGYDTGSSGGAWRRMAASLVSNFFGLCRSKAVEDHGMVNFLKSWADLHRFEGLGRGSIERSWFRVVARG